MEQIGPYQLQEELGRGGMAAVYRARGPAGEVVALKVLHAEGARQPTFRQRFELEANALRRLEHPHLVRALAAGEHQGCPWLALEFVDGPTLADALKRSGTLSVERTVELGVQLSRAVGYAHSCSVVHRDLTPANVLLRDGQAVLTDFGLALDQVSETKRLSQTGAFLGTPGYWSPEQALGRKAAIGPATDIYGLGAVLYACLTGKAPQQGDTLAELVSSLQSGRIPAPHTLTPAVPAWLSQLCMRCLAEDPTERPDAGELARALRQGPGSQQPAKARRSWPLTLLVLSAMALSSSLLLVWVIVTLEPPASRPPEPHDPAQTQPTPEEPEQRKNPNARSLLAQTQTLLREGRYSEALSATKAILLLEPDDPHALLFRARCLRRLKREKEAFETLNHLVALAPQFADAYFEQGRLHTQLGEYRKAASHMKQASELSPTVKHLTNLGEALQLCGEYDEALAALERVLDLEPTHQQALTNRAGCLVALERHSEGLEASTAALQLAPDDTSALHNRGVAYEALGRLDEALSDFNRSLELKPSVPRTHFMRGVVLMRQERTIEAAEAYTRAAELAPDNAATFANRGAARLKLRLYELAIEDLDRAIRLAPSYDLPYLNRAVAKHGLGRTAAALADCDLALGMSLTPQVEERVRKLRADCVRKLQR